MEKASYTILVTRPEHQANSLCQLINGKGWDAFRFPTLEIQAIKNDKINRQIKEIDHFHWLIFISANAVNFAIRANDGKIEAFSKIPVVAIGKATEKALKSAGLSVTLVPEQSFNTEGLLATQEMMQINGQSCLIARGQGGRETLANTLRDRGAIVEYLEVYKRIIPSCFKPNTIDVLDLERIDIITLTSGEALNNLLKMTPILHHKIIKETPLVVISQRIKKLAENCGFRKIAVTKELGDRAIIDTITKVRSNSTWHSQ